MKKRITHLRYLAIGLTLLSATGCDSMLEVDLPSSELASTTIYTSEETAESAVNGIYYSMVTTTYYNSLHSVLGQTSDELMQNSLTDNVYTNNDIPVDDSYISQMWSELYKTVYDANSVLEGVASSTMLSSTSAARLSAEAKFIRAFCYFYLVNLWGDVPLITTTEVQVNSLAPRASAESVYNNIISDLNDAVTDLPDDYSYYSSKRFRATKWAAYALRARVNLYQEKWADAEADASQVIGQTGLYALVTNLSANNSPFITDNTEAILQIPLSNLEYTYEGSLLFTNSGSYLLRNGMNLFEGNDARLANWTISVSGSDGSTYLAPLKYKNAFGSSPSERSTVLRLAELYLIRAEARAEQSNLTGAVQDLKEIRGRAQLEGSGSADDSDQSAVLQAIRMERQRELFAEFGHRWLDLKRTGTADNVLGAIKTQWTSDDALYPIPENAIKTNPNLTQNPGYYQ